MSVFANFELRISSISLESIFGIYCFTNSGGTLRLNLHGKPETHKESQNYYQEDAFN